MFTKREYKIRYRRVEGQSNSKIHLNYPYLFGYLGENIDRESETFVWIKSAK